MLYDEEAGLNNDSALLLPLFPRVSVVYYSIYGICAHRVVWHMVIIMLQLKLRTSSL